MKQTVEKQFQDFVTENNCADKKILLAFSGGSDSVALCSLLHIHNIKFAIAHCNYQLRGDESNTDAIFAKDLSKKYSVDFYLKTFDEDQLKDSSIQSNARKLRYDWFTEICRNEDFDLIATAHHLDDNIETFFLRLTRGAGLKGLSGISASKNKIIRPLLNCSKQEIIEYVQRNDLDYREDSSNKKSKYNRNYFRNKVLPLLDKRFPNWRKRSVENMSHLKESDELLYDLVSEKYEGHVRKKSDDVFINIKDLIGESHREMILYYLLREFNFSYNVSLEVLKVFLSTEGTVSGKQFYSKTHHAVSTEKELHISELIQEEAPETFFIGEADRSILVHDQLFIISKENASENIKHFKSNDKNRAVLDSAELNFPLHLRRWRKGDRFKPLGMNNFKKLSDFFIDEKVDLIEKRKKWLLCSGDDIIWISGMRIDDRFKVDNNTDRVIEVCVRTIDEN
ncbi:MAG: tRNA lysidine(34) synthetase TilS [Bacteroidia bacterium]|nr:tRNA lysidine(34) synthetase TilS [Bacteroidia bacterium]